jgi:hypothetical protein
MAARKRSNLKLKHQNRTDRLAEIAKSQRPAVEPQPAPAQPPLGKHAPGLDIVAGGPPSDSATTAPLPPMPEDRRLHRKLTQQQVQSTPPVQPGSENSPAQAAANPTAPTSQDGNKLPSQTPPESAAQQAQSTPQPEQMMPATEEPAAEPQQQSAGEWVKSSGATVRSGPSPPHHSSRNSQIRHGDEGGRPSVGLGADRQS